MSSSVSISYLRKNLCKCTHELIHILLVEYDWRLYLQHISFLAVAAHQNMLISHHHYDSGCSLAILLLCLFRLDNVNALKQSHASHISNKVVFAQFLELLAKVGSRLFSVFLEFLVLYNIQDGICSCGSQWVSTVSAEILNVSFSEAFCYCFSTNDSRYWETIPHGLANRNNIRNDSIILESPKGLSNSTETSLNFIANTNYTFAF